MPSSSTTKIEASQTSLVDAIIPHFPRLPNDFYTPQATEQITEHVPITGPDTPINPITDVLQLAWALVISTQTNSANVVYGLEHRKRTQRTSNGEHAQSASATISPRPFRWTIKPEDIIQQTLTAIAAQREQLQSLDEKQLQNYTTQSPEFVVSSRFRNVLVIDEGWDRGLTTNGKIEQNGDEFGQKKNEHALTVHCRLEDTAVQIQATFDPAVIPSGQMRLLLVQLADTVRMSVENAGMVKDLQQLGPGGLEQVCRWNTLRREDGEVEFIHDMIEQQLKSTPNADAVCAWDGSLTYAELDRWSLHLAAKLRDDGVGPGVFVGIFMSKSVSVVVSILAVMRAGGAFVLLFPSLPIHRLRLLCEMTPVGLILTQASLSEDAAQLGPKVQMIEHDVEAIETVLVHWTPPEVHCHDPLYAIYTSGSTGVPKGVIVERGSYGPGVRRFINRVGLGPGIRVFQSVSYSFAVSVNEHLTALASGACICVPSDEQLETDTEGAVLQLTATWAVMTPSVARTLNPCKLTCLATMVLTGELIDKSDLDQWFPFAKVYHWYGQSETASTWLAQELSTPTHGLGWDPCCINTGAYWIVDPEDHSRLAPLGAEGELMLESSALASEYRDNPKETARSFIQSPQWLEKLRTRDRKSRCLLTGDLARYSDSDGTVSLTGRKGGGIKIRGQRIELGEIQSQLRLQFPGAKHVIVEAVEPAGGIAGHKVLLGFVSGLTGSIDMDVRRAIAELRRVLPSFMVPSTVVSVEEMPITSTGKIDRKALRNMMAALTVPEIMAYNHQERPAYQGPSNSQERILQSIVEEVLHLAPSSVSLHNSFFEAGGDSLTARQLAAHARSHGASLTVADILEAPTLSDLAVRLEKVKSESDPEDDDPFKALQERFFQTIPTFLQDCIEDVYPTMGTNARAVYEYRNDYQQFVIRGPLDREKFRRACEIFIQATAVMRSMFVPFEDQLLHVVLRSIGVPYEELTVPDDEGALSWAREFSIQDQKVDIAIDKPVIRFFLVQKSTEEHVLVLRISHALYDAGCFQHLGNVLSAAYNNEPMPVAASFAEYTRAAAGLRTPEALDYWASLISGSEITRLPRESGGDQTLAMYPGEFTYSPPPKGITIATAIKAAWSWVLYEQTGKMDILFGQIGNTRGINLPGASETIGCCLNITAVRVRFEEHKGKTVRDLFDTIHNQQVQGHRYETVEWSDVVARDGRWPRDTEFDSFVLHENFGALPTLNLGEAVGKIASPVFASPPTNQHAMLTWPGDGVLTAFLFTGRGLLQKDYAEGLVASFGRTLMNFLDFPDAILTFINSEKIE
ncbi:hypothetical protein BJY04DRAFT_225274 [Aspergillus karnatakaensis]|uniref:uncharacterized protein n=1 Tax=Aspergillus karnatakaensis TaxID=1810916 RepID=UPI003CCC9C6A